MSYPWTKAAEKQSRFSSQGDVRESDEAENPQFNNCERVGESIEGEFSGAGEQSSLSHSLPLSHTEPTEIPNFPAARNPELTDEAKIRLRRAVAYASDLDWKRGIFVLAQTWKAIVGAYRLDNRFELVFPFVREWHTNCGHDQPFEIVTESFVVAYNRVKCAAGERPIDAIIKRTSDPGTWPTSSTVARITITHSRLLLHCRKRRSFSSSASSTIMFSSYPALCFASR